MPRILIIEDDPQIRYLYQQAISFQGIEVETSDDASQALKRLGEEHFDLVLLDLLLPGENGIEFLHRLKQQVGSDHEMPIVIVTHLQDDTVKQQALVLGVAAYLTKGEHSIGDIVREVRTHVGTGGTPAAG